MNINSSLLKSIQTIIDKAVSLAPFDKTRQAQITTNNEDGTYTIRLDGVLYNNIPSYPQNLYMDVGSIVRVVMPTNNTSQMYIRGNRQLVDMILPEIYIDATDIDSQTGYATAGTDMDLYNALVDLGWVNDVIVV